ncbi:predicted protein [Sclerotinia sclerotiorum 1980 UF-70]|uniref:Uncharacterized protein n=1 Tax=Sclerotinia sclerotiorum (strain ATCC 18683 / 1980 / Ss-1) TaxID=665079 RepID=A7EDH0_SCLS1|nr:predicted protein [Sclerotinia sclerotiorum 1980 UF-70]EDO00886.1 predicted protein [Sclerotinia sclerotiorum 1980 UF-70]
MSCMQHRSQSCLLWLVIDIDAPPLSGKVGVTLYRKRQLENTLLVLSEPSPVVPSKLRDLSGSSDVPQFVEF